MITTKKELNDYIHADAKAHGRNSVQVKLLGDEIWRFQVVLRKLEYYKNQTGVRGQLMFPVRYYYNWVYHRLSIKLGFTIPVNVFEKGLCIVHRGTIVVAKTARIGMNCRIHEGVTIGATNGSNQAAIIGDNVFIASGAKIIGNIMIADDVAIGANAVVTTSIVEKGTTWGGIPAKKISNHSSKQNLNAELLLNMSN